MTKFFIISFLLLPTWLISQTSVQTAVNAITKYWAFENAGISISVRNTENNMAIASHNSDLVLSPASTVKLFSSATALELLGHDYRPKTKLYTDGTIGENGVLNGNLYLRPLGDPTLGSKYFTAHGSEDQFLTNWVMDMRFLGIKEVQGKVIVDGSAFGYQGCPDGWTWSDMGNYYGAGPSAVIVNDNILHYYFRTAGVGETSVLVRMVPEIDGIRVLNTIKGAKVSGDNSLIYSAPYSQDIYTSGTLPYNRNEFVVKGTVPDPERLLATKFYYALIDKGVKVLGGFDYNRNRILAGMEPVNYSDVKLLKTWEGNTIEQIAFHTNMKSVNIFAEQFVCLVGYEKEGNGSTETGLDVMIKYWKKKLDFQNLNLKDGSGLSRSNAVSSSQFCSLLNYMAKGDRFGVFKSTLPTAGQSGTLINVGKGQMAEGRVFAKSGTMNRVKSYAGYVSTKSNKLLSFSIIVNNYNCSNAAVVDQMEKLFNAMAIY